MSEKRICLGAFAGAHGVKGETKIKTFTDAPENIAAYGALETEDGKRRFSFKIVRVLKPDFIVVSAPEIQSREDAENLKGVRLYVDRDKLPAPDEDEFYLEDLVGLNVIDETGVAMGRVEAVYNFGGGDVIEVADIPGVKGKHLTAFTRENAPAIDLVKGVITILRAALIVEDDAGNGEERG